MKILMIGLGSIGQRHLRNIRKKFGNSVDIFALRSQRQVPLLSETMTPIEGETVEEKYNVTSFTEINSAFESKPEICFICNPSSLHLEFMRRALQHECHVFVEKPVITKREDLVELKKLLSDRNQVVYAGFQQRFHPCFQTLRTLLSEERYGRVISASLCNSEYMPYWHKYEDYRISYAGRSELGGGSVMTQIHEIDFITKLFGLPDSLMAVGGKFSDLDIDVEDTVRAVLEYTADRRFCVDIKLDYHAFPGEKWIELQFSQGKLRSDFMTRQIKWTPVTTGESEIVASFPDWDRNQMFVDQLNHFFEVVGGSVPAEVSADDTIGSATLSLAIKESIETRRSFSLRGMPA